MLNRKFKLLDKPQSINENAPFYQPPKPDKIVWQTFVYLWKHFSANDHFCTLFSTDL